MDERITIIFDFDGTIVDSMRIMFGVVNRFAQSEGLKKIDINEIESFREKGSREIIRELGIPFYKLPLFVRRIRRELEEYIGTTEVVDGLNMVLSELKRRNVRMGILTSNSRRNVENFLRNKIEDIFEFVYCGSSLFGKDRVLRQLMREKQIDRSRVVYVGDETRDIEAAKKCGVKSVGVTWGYNSRKPLEKIDPDLIIDKPDELLKLFDLWG